MNDFISATIIMLLLSICIVVMVRNRQIDDRITKLSKMSDEDLSDGYEESKSEEDKSLVLDAIARKWGVE
jgi:hypothetical protein